MFQILASRCDAERPSVAEAVSEKEFVALITPMIKSYAKNRLEGERFGDYAVRSKWIAATTEGKAWYDKSAEEGAKVEV